MVMGGMFSEISVVVVGVGGGGGLGVGGKIQCFVVVQWGERFEAGPFFQWVAKITLPFLFGVMCITWILLQ